MRVYIKKRHWPADPNRPWYAQLNNGRVYDHTIAIVQLVLSILLLVLVCMNAVKSNKRFAEPLQQINVQLSDEQFQQLIEIMQHE